MVNRLDLVQEEPGSNPHSVVGDLRPISLSLSLPNCPHRIGIYHPELLQRKSVYQYEILVPFMRSFHSSKLCLTPFHQISLNVCRLEKEIEDLEREELTISAKEKAVLKKLKSVERTAEDIIKVRV